MRHASRLDLRGAIGLLVFSIAGCGGADKPEGATRERGGAAREPVAVSTGALTLAGISATKVGNYSLVGSTYTLGSNSNYRAGNVNTTNGTGGTDDWRRGYAVFDLSSVDGTITGAALRLGNGSNNGSSPQTLSLWPVAPGNIANLGIGGTASTLYNDLGDVQAVPDRPRITAPRSCRSAQIPSRTRTASRSPAERFRTSQRPRPARRTCSRSASLTTKARPTIGTCSTTATAARCSF